MTSSNTQMTQMDWLWSHALGFGHSPCLSKKPRFWEFLIRLDRSASADNRSSDFEAEQVTGCQTMWCLCSPMNWELHWDGVTPVLPVTGRPRKAFAHDSEAPSSTCAQ
jgi:hypothetical protein